MSGPIIEVNRKIGLTGGIASGKSSVSGMLAGLLQCEHIDADTICRQLLEPQSEGWKAFTARFGKKYLTGSGAVDRPLLRADLFASDSFRREVDGIIHPLVKKSLKAGMDKVLASGPHARVLVEVPLLYEVKWEDLFDKVIVVYAGHEACRNRLMERDGVDRDAAEKSLQSQLPLSEKIRMADYVVDNSGTVPETMRQVERLAEILQNNGTGVEKKLDSKK